MIFRYLYILRTIADIASVTSLTGATSPDGRASTLIDRARRLVYWSPFLLTFDELCDIADDELFSKVVRHSNHILHPLLPPPSTASQRYNLRHRVHSL